MITVQLTDQTVRVGGDFQSALKFVKSLPGRKYDSTYQLWIVPMTSKELLAKAYPFYPVELSDGTIVTRFGNPYTPQERAAFSRLQAVERKASEAIIEAEGKAYDRLIEQLRSSWPNASDQQIKKLASIIVKGEIDDAVDMGELKFSSKDRERLFISISDEYFRAITSVDESFNGDREKALDQD